MTAPFVKSRLLEEAKVTHGFFSRRGGVSDGDYASLNTGPGSNDKADDVARNRAICAAALGCDPLNLMTCYQIHSPEVLAVDKPWSGAPKKADALVTNQPGLLLGVLAADCMPWLLADPDAGIIGAAHAGWRGALAGVLENTVSAMVKLGAKTENIIAALGPCLRQPRFEVGLELLEAFVEKHPEASEFFSPSVSAQKRQLNLAGFGAWRLQESGVRRIDDIGVCTLEHADDYFSYRGSRRAGAADYGRNLSAIALV